MKKEKIKIVYNRNGELVSTIVRGKPCVTYSTKKYIKAPQWCTENGYNLTVFCNLKTALEFLKYFYNFTISNNFEVWKVSVKGKVKLPPLLLCSPLEKGMLIISRYRDWHEGTEMYKKVKLIERIL